MISANNGSCLQYSNTPAQSSVLPFFPWHLTPEKDNYGFWVPTGSFGWRNKRYSPNNHISKVFQSEIDNLQMEHPILKIGLFNGSINRLLEVKKSVDDYINGLHWG